jgi:hypothetical protein
MQAHKVKVAVLKTAASDLHLSVDQNYDDLYTIFQCTSECHFVHADCLTDKKNDIENLAIAWARHEIKPLEQSYVTRCIRPFLTNQPPKIVIRVNTYNRENAAL